MLLATSNDIKTKLGKRKKTKLKCNFLLFAIFFIFLQIQETKQINYLILLINKVIFLTASIKLKLFVLVCEKVVTYADIHDHVSGACSVCTGHICKHLSLISTL